MEENRSSKGQTPSVQHCGTLIPRQGVDSSDLAVLIRAVDGVRLLGQRVEEMPDCTYDEIADRYVDSNIGGVFISVVS